MYDDPWSALNSTMVPTSLFPRDQQPAIGAKPTAASLGMSQDDFNNYVHVNDDGSWAVSKNSDGSPRAKGFMGMLGAAASWVSSGVKGIDKGISNAPVIGQAYEANKWLVKKTVIQPLDIAATGSYWMYTNAVSRPLTAAILQLGKVGQGNAGALLDSGAWSQSYDAAEHRTRKATQADVDAANKAAENDPLHRVNSLKVGDDITTQQGISPGQALANAGETQGMNPLETYGRSLAAIPTFGLSMTLGAQPDAKYMNESYLYDTNYWQKQEGWKYNVGTGLMDATASVALDPTIAGGKVLKPIRLATRVVKVAEGEQAGAKIAGITVVKPRTAEQLVNGDAFTNLAKTAIDNKWSPNQINNALERGRGSRGSAFTTRDMGARLSQVLSQADNVDDWRLAARFSMGDEAAFAELSQRSQSFALAYGKALDNRVDITNADKIYKKSFASLVDNNFQAKPINPARWQYATEDLQRPFGPIPEEYEAAKYKPRSIEDRVKVDEQGGLFIRSPYVTADKAAAEEISESPKNFEQLQFEGKGFQYEVKPLDPSSIPTASYASVNIPGLIEWKAGVQSSLEATNVQLSNMANRDGWLAKIMGDNLNDPAVVNPLFGSMQEARFAGLGRNVVKQAERRQLQYLGARSTEGFQARLIQNGIYGGAVRVIGKMGDRLPTGVINHNEADATARLSDYLKASPIDGESAAYLTDNYSRIADKTNSVKYITDVVEPALLESFGKKYGLDIDTTQEMYNDYRRVSQGEMDKARNPSQVFSATTATGENGQPIRIDQLADGEKVAAHPQLSTQLQYTSALPNLKAFDRFLVKNAPMINRMRRSGISAYDTLDNFAGSFNGLFKLGNLLRVSYVGRNVAEETLAQAAKFGAMAVMSNAARGGASVMRNALPSGAVLDDLGRVIRKVEVNRSLPMVQNMNEAVDEHIAHIESEIARRTPASGTFGRRAEIEDAEGLSYWQDRLAKAKDTRAEFQSYEGELLQHAQRQSKALGEGTFVHNGRVVPEAFNENYVGAIPRDQITSSDSYRTVFGRIQAAISEDMLRTGNYKTLTPSDDGHLDAWKRAVNLQLLQDPVGKRIAQDTTGDSAIKFLRSPEGSLYRKNLGEAGGREPAEHVRLIKAMVDQYIPESMREQAAKNGKVADADFMAVAEGERPVVHGEELRAATQGNQGAFSWFDRLNEKWFNGLPRMASDRLSWQPTYVRAHRMHMQELLEQHDRVQAKFGQSDFVSMDTMNKFMSKADGMARQTMREVLYEPNRTNTAHALRYISPFFSAYTDSLSRWAGLVTESPDLVGKVAKIYNAPVAANLVTDRNGDKVDENGNNSAGQFVGMNDRVFNFQINPLTKNLPPSIKDMKISVGSLNVVTPGEPWWSPGFGPVVAIPADTVMRNYPTASKYLNWINPYGTQAESTQADIMRSIAPKFAEDIYDKYDTSGQKYQDALMASYRAQMVDYHQNGGALPDWKKAESDANSLFNLNALADGILPGNVRSTDKYQFYVDALKSLRQQDASKANDLFMARYGKDFKQYADALMFTQSATKSKTGVPSTVEGLAASHEFSGLIKQNPELGAYIVGDQSRAGEFSQWALLNQKASGDRTTVTAEDRIKQTAVNAGWDAYTKIADAIRADMVNQGYRTLQDKGAEQLAALKQRAILAIANKYPDWAQDYTVSDKDAVPKRIEAFQEIVSNKALSTDPNRTDVKWMAAYLTQRQQFVNMLKARDAQGGSAVLTAKSNEDLSLAWTRFREAIAEKDTKFSATMERYLSNDQLQISMIGKGVNNGSF
jgi:hypothetical protein